MNNNSVILTINFNQHVDIGHGHVRLTKSHGGDLMCAIRSNQLVLRGKIVDRMLAKGESFAEEFAKRAGRNKRIDIYIGPKRPIYIYDETGQRTLSIEFEGRNAHGVRLKFSGDDTRFLKTENTPWPGS